MARKLSMLAPGWWDYTTLDDELLNDAAKLTPEDLPQLSREGFKVIIYDTIEDFYLAEALEYITAWKQATPDNPAGICGPIGPTEQLPLVARIVNELKMNLSDAHFWGMDEWYVNGRKYRSTILSPSKGPTGKCVLTLVIRSSECRIQIFIFRKPIQTRTLRAGKMASDAL